MKFKDPILIKVLWRSIDLQWMADNFLYCWYVAIPECEWFGTATLAFKYPEDAVAFKLKYGSLN